MPATEADKGRRDELREGIVPVRRAGWRCRWADRSAERPTVQGCAPRADIRGMEDDTPTMPLTEVIGLEAWQAYVAETGERPTAEGFVQWVKASAPDVLRVLNESVLVAVAEQLLQSQAGSRSRRSGTS